MKMKMKTDMKKRTFIADMREKMSKTPQERDAVRRASGIAKRKNITKRENTGSKLRKFGKGVIKGGAKVVKLAGEIKFDPPPEFDMMGATVSKKPAPKKKAKKKTTKKTGKKPVRRSSFAKPASRNYEYEVDDMFGKMI